MRLRSGRHTGSKSLNRSPSISNKQLPELYPRVHNNSQRRRRCSRHARRRHPLFYKLYNLSRLYLNGPSFKRPRSSLSDRPSPRLIPSIPQRIRQVLNDLKLLFFDPASSENAAELDTEVNISLLSTRLGWSISSTYQIPIPAMLQELSRGSASPLPNSLPLHAYGRENGPSMNMLPTTYLETRLHASIYHEAKRFEFASLVFPRAWEPFRQASTYEPSGVSLDSDMPMARFLRVPDDFLIDPPPRKSPSPIELQSIAVRGNALVHPRTRSQWETIQSFRMDQPEWRLDTSPSIVERDERRHAGNIDYNQASSDKDSWPQSSIPKFSTYNTPRFYPHRGSSTPLERVFAFAHPDSSEVNRQEAFIIPMELPTRYQLGDIIANIMTCDQIPVSRNVIAEPPRAMRCSNQKFTLSLASLVSPKGLKWDTTQLPVLFAAQHCPKGNENIAIAQIAHSLHQTLLTLVLYYLDTRHELDQQLPSWMAVYGIVYDDEGFSIHAHFPVFHFSPADTGEWTPRKFGWAFYSVPVKLNNRSFSLLSDSRRREIATLLRLQSHARLMLRHLQEWTSYERAARLLYETSDEA